jgi:translation initiation factor IF-3
MVGDEVEPNIYPLDEALKIAKDLELDLVEISPNAEPPVCKVIDYKKFIYDQKKKLRTIKSKAQKVVIKELRFGPNTGEHDFEFKLKHARSFLADGAKVKAFVFFRGRSIIFKDQGQILLLKLAQALEDVGVVEEMPKLDGKKMIMIIAQKKKK